MSGPQRIQPLAPAQRRFWVGRQAFSDPPFGNTRLGLHIEGELDEDALVRAIEAFVQRHDALRMTVHGGETPGFVVHPKVPLDYARVDLSGASEAQIQRYLDEGAARDEPLSRAPLTRWRLVRKGPQRHTLIATIEHIICDGYSLLAILPRELITLYAAFQAGEEPKLPEIHSSFAAFALWQVSEHADPAFAAHVDYWVERLRDAPAALELPTDRRRPAVIDPHAKRVYRLFPPEVAEALDGLEAERGWRPAEVLFAAWNVLLSRYTRAEDIVVGAPLANRIEPFREVFGCLMNPLARRTDLSGDPSFTTLMQRLKDDKRASYPHRRASVDAVLSRLPASPDLSRNSLWQTMFNYMDFTRVKQERAGLKVDVQRLPVAGTVDLILHLEKRPEGLYGILEFLTALFDRATVERMLAQLERLVLELARDPERPISRLPLLSPEERELVVHTWNDTDGPYPDDVLMHQPFERNAGEHPERVALAFQDDEVSYGELNARANRLAHYLIRQGIQPGQLVGLCVERSPELIVSMLAILKAGGAYVPIDPAYPADRQAFMLEDTQAPLVISQRAVAEPLADAPCRVLLLDDPRLAQEIAVESELDPEPRQGPTDLAYVIYTSGSTGRPKGVVVRHQPALNLMDWVNGTFDVGPADRLLFVTSPCFDLSVYDIFGTLMAGGTIRVTASAELRDPDRLIHYLTHDGITFWDSAPAALAQLVPFFPDGCPTSKLRLAFLSGDWIPVPLPDQIRQAFPGTTVVSLGGATEATVWSNVHVVDEVDPAWNSIPYGRPIRNARYYVLDPHLEPAPIGVPGELFIGGGCLASGYHNRPELNAERFLPDPFSGDPAYKLYRTGDMARFGADGVIEFLGRVDHQVKVRGYRIELGEIDTVLARHPAVERCVVLAPADATGERVLVAYVVLSQDADEAELYAHLNEALPAFMVPSHLVRLDAIPLTANGKVDRKALPSPLSREEGVYIAPRDATERELAEIWGRALGVERVSVHETFAALGGTSVRAARIVAEVRKRFGRQVTLGEFYRAPSVAALAKHLSGASRGEQTIHPRGPGGPVWPLTSSQLRIWLAAQFSDVEGLYNVTSELRFTGVQSTAALERAFARLLERHPAFRTLFVLSPQGEPGQRFAPEPTAALEVLDLQDLAEPAREARYRALLKDEQARRFDLAQSAWHATLAVLAPGDHRLVFNLHHALIDEWGLTVAARDLGELLREEEGAGDAALPELVVDMADVAVHERAHPVGGSWDDVLQGLEPLELPLDRPRPPTISFAGGHHRFQVTAGAVRQRLRELCREEGVTPFNGYLAAFLALLQRVSRQEDLVLAMPAAKREQPELEGVVGCLIQMVPVRVHTRSDTSFRDLLRKVRDVAQASLERPPFRPDEGEGQELTNLLTRVLFSYVDVPTLDPRWSMEVLESEGAKYELALTVVIREELTEGAFSFRSQLFDAKSVAQLGATLGRLLEAATASPDAPLTQLDLLDPAERQALLVERNATERALPARTLHSEIEARADLQPEAPAVSYHAQRLSYAELETRANQLAHRLRELGVGPDSIVGVCLPRGLEVVVALLGILKSGAAYLPLDPEYPPERLTLYLEDSGAQVVVTAAVLAELVSGPGVEHVLLDQEEEALLRLPTGRPTPVASPEHLAYAIYTSGSTGRPKGVLVEHRNVVNFLLGMDERVRLDPPGTWLAQTSISFDISVLELLGGLSRGFHLILSSSDEGFAELVAAHGVTHFQCTPSQATLLLHDPRDVAALASLQQLLVGGEALPEQLASQLLDALQGGELINMYGPTETTIWSSTHAVTREDAPMSLGRPIANTQLYVLDEQLQPAPTGVPGELWIGGAGVTRGYHRRPELTAERFRPDPFREGNRIYKTGDLVRYRSDGRLEFLGRTDFQVKLRGHRIELGEIESALLDQPQVSEAVALVREDRPGHQLLVGYVVAPADTDPQTLREALKDRLTPIMVPAVIVVLAELPLTPNGKADRKALPAPEEAQDPQARDLERVERGRWCLRPTWEPAPFPPRTTMPRSWLVFLDDAGLGARLAEALGHRGADVVRVTPGDTFHRDGPDAFRLAPELGLAGYQQLFDALAAEGRLPERVLHLWGVTGDRGFRPGSTYFHRVQEQGYQSLVHLGQVLAQLEPAERMPLMVVANERVAVTSGDVVEPAKATLLGPCLAIPRELGVPLTLLDVTLPAPNLLGRRSGAALQALADRVWDELDAEPTTAQLGLRGGARWTLAIRPLPAPPLASAGALGGTYAVYDALGPLGFALAEHLARRGAGILALGWTPLPTRERWDGWLARYGGDEPVSRAIRRVRELEASGARVRVAAVDLADSVALERELREAEAELGPLRAVVHAGGARPRARLTQLSEAVSDEAFHARVYGSQALAEVVGRIAPRAPVVLCAPLDAFVAHHGRGASAAAAAFQDALAAHMAHSAGARVVCLNLALDEDGAPATGAPAALSPDEVAGALDAALAGAWPELIVSPVALEDLDALEAARARTPQVKDHVEPRDAIEEQLAQFWREGLGVTQVGVREDFFEAGGHSLIAVRILARIRQSFGLDWPLATLFAAPTIEAWAERIRQARSDEPAEEGPEFEFVVELAPDGGLGLTPVFIAAGARGNVLNLRHLARHLDPGRAVYALQARGLLGESKPHESIEAAARDYLAEIRRIQPHGPYLFGGFCSGGIIALDMAVQLREQGERVALLALMDATAPVVLNDGWTRKDSLRYFMRRVQTYGAGYVLDHVKDRAAWELAKLRGRAPSTPEPAEDAATYRSDQVWDATFRSMRAYAVPHYDGRVKLYKPRVDDVIDLGDGRVVDAHRTFLYADNRWGEFLPNLEIVDVPGDHDGFVLEPAVRTLASHLRLAVAEAEAPEPEPVDAREVAPVRG
ncbi:MAG: amino acid adenylation domain-containing protein [Planctomycetota bacterium]